MTRQEFDSKLDGLEAIEHVTPEDVKNIIIDFINFLQNIIKNKKIDDFLEAIEDRIEQDKFGIFAAIIAAIKGSILKKKGV